MEPIFMSKPDQLEKKLEQWKEQAGANMKVDVQQSFSGHNVYAITLTDFSVRREQKTALYVAQPHAHEPATTAGMVDVIEQLVTGKDLWGHPTTIDRHTVLSQTILTFNPIGNPYGREHAPYLYWDGSEVTNEQFWCVMRGEDPETPGKMWERLGIFDTREIKVPDPVGIVYEPIDEFRYVEPNRNQLSSFFKLFHRMDNQFQYQYWLDLHQTEFAKSANQCMVMLPLDDLPVDQQIKEENEAWAGQISRVWQEEGFRVVPPIPLPYVGVQADYFRENWGEIDKRMKRITIEVKNNAADTPASRQMDAIESSIITTLRRLTNS